MQITRKTRRIAAIFGAVFAILLITPARILVWPQIAAVFGVSAPLAVETADLHSALRSFPNDLQAQLGVANDVGHLRAVAARFPNEPAVYAVLLRAECASIPESETG